MEEKTLMKLSTTVLLIGLIILTIILKLEELPISYRPDELQEDEYIKIKGSIKELKNYGNMTRMTIEHPKETQVTVFQPINITTDKDIEVLGRVNIYEGKRSIIAEKITSAS